MDHPDIISLICNCLNDVDKFAYLSVTKSYDSLKEKTWFNGRVHIYRIYNHKYFNRFTNVIICTGIKKCVDENGKLIASRKIKLPAGIKRLEMKNTIKVPKLLPEGLTHYSSPNQNDVILPKSITHLKSFFIDESLYSQIFTDDMFRLDNLQFLKFELIPHNKTINNPMIGFIGLSKKIKYLSCPGDWSKYPLLSTIQHIHNEHYSPNPEWKIPSMHLGALSNYSNLYIGLKKLRLCKYDSKFNGSISYLINLNILKINCLEGIINLDNMPPNITSLTIKNAYNSNIEILPKFLIYLSIGDLFEFNNFVLPNLTHFKIKFTFFRFDANDERIGQPANIIEKITSPKLYFLKINDNIMPKNIPSTVRELVMGNMFTSPIKLLIPNFITHLTFGNEFNKSIRHNIPSKITHLTFGKLFRQMNLGRDIPQTVTHLTLSSKCYTLNKDTLRDRGLSITVQHVYEKDPFNMEKY